MDLFKATLSRKGGDTAEKVSANCRQGNTITPQLDIIPGLLMQQDATQKRTKLVPGTSDGEHLKYSVLSVSLKRQPAR